MAEVLQNQELVQELDLTSAFKRVLKAASFTDQLAKGLHEVCKAIDNPQKPILCLLADDCDEPQYKKLVEALCRENGIPLVRVALGKQIGEWIGLCKYDKLMNPKDPRRCSSCVLKGFAANDEASAMVQKAVDGQNEISLE